MKQRGALVEPFIGNLDDAEVGVALRGGGGVEVSFGDGLEERRLPE